MTLLFLEGMNAAETTKYLFLEQIAMKVTMKLGSDTPGSVHNPIGFFRPVRTYKR